jgi:fermentation-respiration switch protein FrsA (DUF1100 family)
MNPLVKTSAPILIPQGEADTTVFPFYTNKLKDELIADGDQVTYKTYPGINHVGVVTAGEADVLAFFQARLPAARKYSPSTACTRGPHRRPRVTLD